MVRFKKPFSLYKREIKSSKKPVYHFWYYDKSGKRRSSSTGQTSKCKAEAFAQDFVENLERRTLAQISETWWTWDHPYVQNKVARGLRISRGYVDSINSHLLNQILPYLGEKTPNELTRKAMNDWILKLYEKKLSASTVGHSIKALRPILEELVHEETLSKHPTEWP